MIQLEYTIRRLNADDQPLVNKMDTGIQDDYVLHVFEHLIREDVLYGLFINNQLAILGGYSIYGGSYAMLGRLRSDRRFRGQDLGSKLMLYVIDEAFRDERIHWVGANTQEDNLPARRVLTKLGLTPIETLHGAITKNTNMLESGAEPWNKIPNLSRKKEWLEKMFIQSGALFPYECYYPFPATWSLFKNEEIAEWNFYENPSQTRCLITKADRKGHHYLHVIYPWSDLTQQEGLWETVSRDYHDLLIQTQDEERETYIWKDLTKDEITLLPDHHEFELPSAWILHGMSRDEWMER